MNKYTIESISRFSKSKSGAPFKDGSQKVNMKLLGVDTWASFFDYGDKVFLKEGDIIEGEIAQSKDGKFMNFHFDADKAGRPRMNQESVRPTETPVITREEFLNMMAKITKIDNSIEAVINHLKISTDGLPF